jgi:hypothetical protein
MIEMDSKVRKVLAELAECQFKFPNTSSTNSQESDATLTLFTACKFAAFNPLTEFGRAKNPRHQPSSNVYYPHSILSGPHQVP